MRLSKRFSSVAVACAVALLISCDVSLLQVDSSSGSIQIQVFRGPINPVQRAGEVNDAPVALARVAAIGGDFTRRAATDLFGFASLPVSSGSYRVTVEFCPGAMGLPQDQHVTVLPGRSIAVRFDCDTGIR